MRTTTVMLSIATISCLLLSSCGDSNTATSKRPANPQSIARGKYLATMADCISCHTAPDSAAFAGRYPLATPFGVIYGSNITPDKATGIGLYSREEFYRVLHDGRNRHGQPLYPAMPYTSYQMLSQQDTDDIYDYLMSLPPITLQNKEPELKFPYNIRWSLYFWQWLFLHQPQLPKTTNASQTRGGYLANALAHCAECHSPRNLMGALQWDKAYKGSLIGRYEAPDITPAALASRGWTADGLRQLLKTGIAPQGTVYADMFPVVHNSTRFMKADDVGHMVNYLSGPTGLPPPQPLKPQPLPDVIKREGRQVYLNLCAGCHGTGGEGKPHVAPAMKGNSTVRLASSTNLLVAVMDGISEQQFGQIENMQAMPGFADKASDQEIANLANMMRATWGGQPANVTPENVKQLRLSDGK